MRTILTFFIYELWPNNCYPRWIIDSNRKQRIHWRHTGGDGVFAEIDEPTKHQSSPQFWKRSRYSVNKCLISFEIRFKRLIPSTPRRDQCNNLKYHVRSMRSVFPKREKENAILSNWEEFELSVVHASFVSKLDQKITTSIMLKKNMEKLMCKRNPKRKNISCWSMYRNELYNVKSTDTNVNPKMTIIWAR